MADTDRPRELDILSGPQLGFLSLVRIIAVLIARTGETTVEIGAAELEALPEVPALSTWRNEASFTDSIHVELPDAVVEQIRDFGRGLEDDRAGIVDAEIVEDSAAAFGLVVAGRADVTPVVGRERVVNRDKEV